MPNYYRLTLPDNSYARFADFYAAEEAAKDALDALVVSPVSPGEAPKERDIAEAQARLRGDVLHVQYRVIGDSSYRRFDRTVSAEELETVSQALASAEPKASMAATNTLYASLEATRFECNVFNLSAGHVLLATVEVTPEASSDGDIEEIVDDEDDTVVGWKLVADDGSEVATVSVETLRVEAAVVEQLKKLESYLYGSETGHFDEPLNLIASL